MNYPVYANNQMYLNELQVLRDRIDTQIRNAQQNQMQQPVTQPITQNFQIAPQQNTTELEAKYAENIDEVKSVFVSKINIFTTKDFSTIWIKDASGKIKTYSTEEVIELDEKDKEIMSLKREINELKEERLNANKSVNTSINEPIENEKPTRISSTKRGNSK